MHIPPVQTAPLQSVRPGGDDAWRQYRDDNDVIMTRFALTAVPRYDLARDRAQPRLLAHDLELVEHLALDTF